MCEIILFFGGAVIAGLLLWIVVLDNQVQDYKNGVTKR